MKLYFAGGEIPSHRNILTAVGAEHIALSYMGLRRRIKFARPWFIEDKFPDEAKVFLDSGAFTINKGEGDSLTQGEVQDIANHYQEFVAANIDRLDMVSEFDALVLGHAWIKEQREDFYDDLPPEKFLPIWHPDHGLDNLRALAEKYPNVGVPSVALEGRNLIPLLNSLSCYLHGMGMTSIDGMKDINWGSVSSTSWISPKQYGDTIVWTGRELKRYPKKYKEQARKRHRTLFNTEGFDSAKIEADDSDELLRLSVWSWTQFVQSLEGVTTVPETVPEAFTENEGDHVDTPPAETGKSISTAVAVPRDVVPLPIIGFESREEEYLDGEGATQTRTVKDFKVRSDSTRKCITCHLKGKCPAYEPASLCAYNIPVVIKTKDQFLALQNSLIEMQAQRVMFMRFAEEVEGGYSDPNLSQEVDRLQKMLKTKHDMETEGFDLRISAKATGQGAAKAGVLDRLFGAHASEKARELEGGPVAADQAMEYIDAEFTESPPN